MVTVNPSTHYNLNTGAIVKGMQADYVVVDNLNDLNILKTYVAGKCVLIGENVLFDVEEANSKIHLMFPKKDLKILKSHVMNLQQMLM